MYNLYISTAATFGLLGWAWEKELLILALEDPLHFSCWYSKRQLLCHVLHIIHNILPSCKLYQYTQM